MTEIKERSGKAHGNAGNKKIKFSVQITWKKKKRTEEKYKQITVRLLTGQKNPRV